MWNWSQDGFDYKKYQIFMLLGLSEATDCVTSGSWCNPAGIQSWRGEGLEQSLETEGSYSSGHEERIESSIFIPLLSSSFEINHGSHMAVEHRNVASQNWHVQEVWNTHQIGKTQNEKRM